MKEIQIRPAAPADAQALLGIYAPYVEETAVSFEYRPPSLEEFRGRVAHTLERYPYLAALEGGEIVGYAYASPLHARAAYAWSAEASIYLKRECRGRGLGCLLYQELERCLVRQGIVSLNACIAFRETEDERLTQASVRFHQRQGFRLAGRFHQCAYKFDTWYDMIWMEKSIGERKNPPEAVLPFPAVREELYPV